MEEESIDMLLGFHDGAHFLEKPNAVMVLSGFKSIGPAMVVLPRDDVATLIVRPAWDAERATEYWPAMRSIGTDDLLNALVDNLDRHHVKQARVGTAGLSGMPWRIGEQLSTIL